MTLKVRFKYSASVLISSSFYKKMSDVTTWELHASINAVLGLAFLQFKPIEIANFTWYQQIYNTLSML